MIGPEEQLIKAEELGAAGDYRGAHKIYGRILHYYSTMLYKEKQSKLPDILFCRELYEHIKEILNASENSFRRVKERNSQQHLKIIK